MADETLQKKERFSSRKYRLTQITILQAILVPIAFHYIGIDMTITLTVISIIAGSSASYGITNALDSKWGSKE